MIHETVDLQTIKLKENTYMFHLSAKDKITFVPSRYVGIEFKYPENMIINNENHIIIQTKHDYP